MKMKVVAVLVVVCICLDNTSAQRRRPKVVTSGDKFSSLPKKKVDHDYHEYEYQSPNAHPVVEDSGENEQQELRETYIHSKPSKKPAPGFSAGSGLRSIAQGSADQASSAVSNQKAASVQASFVAQSTLAHAASQASATAQAALHGKRTLLSNLEQQSIEAGHALESEILQLQQAKRSAKAAQQAAQQSINHVQVLTAALNNAHTASEHAQQAASEAAAELASQTAMVGTAKQRLEQIEEQLHSARIDFEATSHAANSAAASALQAQSNAAEAAVHASIILKELPSEGTQSDEYASNHNYGIQEYKEYKQSSPQLPTQQQHPTPREQPEYDFAGY